MAAPSLPWFEELHALADEGLGAVVAWARDPLPEETTDDHKQRRLVVLGFCAGVRYGVAVLDDDDDVLE